MCGYVELCLQVVVIHFQCTSLDEERKFFQPVILQRFGVYKVFRSIALHDVVFKVGGYCLALHKAGVEGIELRRSDVEDRCPLRIFKLLSYYTADVLVRRCGVAPDDAVGAHGTAIFQVKPAADVRSIVVGKGAGDEV